MSGAAAADAPLESSRFSSYGDIMLPPTSCSDCGGDIVEPSACH